MTSVRLTIDHLAGGRSRETAAVDASGRTVLRVKGDWAILDDAGRWTLYNAPETMAKAKAGAIDGLINGLLGIDSNLPNIPASVARNAGPGVQTVRRADRPLRGFPLRSSPFATVIREPGAGDGAPGAYRVELVTGAAMVFAPVPDPAATAQSTGFADPRYATYELRRSDGSPVIRHGSRIGRDLNLAASTLDVLDPDSPLDEAVALCLARFHAWRA
jgi:hypothetical protein